MPVVSCDLISKSPVQALKSGYDCMIHMRITLLVANIGKYPDNGSYPLSRFSDQGYSGLRD